jgi:ribosome-binding ATPase YchF (GTP1/OBG family)
VSGNEHTTRFADAVKDEDAEILFISAAIEADIATMDRDDQLMFLEEMGLQVSGVGRLITSAYKLLNYITYFTAGVKEVRAWTITDGFKAPQAAGVIHTDFEKGFIRAEVMHYNDFVEHGSEAACREVGKLRIEGKEYLVKDGDIMHFRFNV